jgi:Flp pilus assembly pilin Flp
MKKIIGKFARNEDGASAIEYATAASIIALGILATLQQLPPAINAVFASIAAILSN